MKARGKTVGISMFAARFLLFLVPLLAVWWLVLPWYGWGLMQTSGMVLRNGLGMPILSGAVHAEGVLNTESRMTFTLTDGRNRTMKIALLVTNVPPFLALVLASTGLSWRRRLRALAIGTLILLAGHWAFIIVAMRWQDALMRASEIPTAMIQFFLTLPFLLWIALAYWEKLVDLVTGEGSERPDSTGANGGTKP